MCGIFGFSIHCDEVGKYDLARITESLAIAMQSRGRDATGIFTVSTSGRMKLRKAPDRAEEYLKARPYIGSRAQVLIGHTRAATQGDPKYPGNNHPIAADHVIGVHNGVISNDYDLYRKNAHWKRRASVDSEAIFEALLQRFPDEPTVDGTKAALEEIEGSMAIAFVDTRQPWNLWLARGSSSPLHVGITAENSLVFASTDSALKQLQTQGLIEFQILNSFEEGTILPWAVIEEPPITGHKFVPKEAFGSRQWYESGWTGSTTYGTRYKQDHRKTATRMVDDRLNRCEDPPFDKILVGGNEREFMIDEVETWLGEMRDYRNCLKVMTDAHETYRAVVWDHLRKIEPTRRPFEFTVGDLVREKNNRTGPIGEVVDVLDRVGPGEFQAIRVLFEIGDDPVWGLAQAYEMFLPVSAPALGSGALCSEEGGDQTC